MFDNSTTITQLQIRSNNNLNINNITAKQKLNINNSIQILTNSQNLLTFRTVGNTLSTAENTDLIAFQHVNLNTTTANSSELRPIS